MLRHSATTALRPSPSHHRTLLRHRIIRSPSSHCTMPKPPISPDRAIHWVLDWDGTITQKDTLDALVNIAKLIKPASDVSQTWSQLSQAYLSEFEATLQKHAPEGKLPNSVLGERSLLIKLEEAEHASIKRVSESRIFEGLTEKVVKDGARNAIQTKEIQLRDGYVAFEDFLSSRMEHQTTDIDVINVLSVNWSQYFIASCLDAALKSTAWESRLANFVQSWPNAIGAYGLSKSKQIQEQLSSLDSSSYMANLMPYQKRICANELEGLVDGSSGLIRADGDHMIVSSSGKLKALQQLRKLNPYTMKQIPVVYVGDSWTDVDCLLAADLGICIRDDEMNSTQRKLVESLKRLGIHCPHITEWETVDDWGVVWARDFVEIKSWVSSLKV